MEEQQGCQCGACKKGVKVAKRKPKTGTDTRPWGVADADKNVVVRCWFKATADTCAKQQGEGYKAVRLKKETP